MCGSFHKNYCLSGMKELLMVGSLIPYFGGGGGGLKFMWNDLCIEFDPQLWPEIRLLHVHVHTRDRSLPQYNLANPGSFREGLNTSWSLREGYRHHGPLLHTPWSIRERLHPPWSLRKRLHTPWFLRERLHTPWSLRERLHTLVH